MRALKAAGRIVKISGGRRPKAAANKGLQDDVIQRARAVVPIDRGEVPVDRRRLGRIRPTPRS